MGLLTFKGGVHPNDGKSLAKDKAIVELLPQGDLVYPLSQHIGAPAKPVVAKGDHVLKGQKIAEAGGFVSAPIYASVSGTVKAIEPRVNPTGSKVNSIIIANDGQYEEVEYPQPKPLSELTKEEILNIIGEAGVVGMGGAGFPTRVKLSPKEPDKIDYIIANCAECEPYITADYRRMLENPELLVEGMRVILKLFDNAKGLFAIEDNKPDCIAKLKELTKDEPRMEVREMMTKYPQGAERQLIFANTGRAINSTMLPADAGCVVDNVETIISIYNAVVKGIPSMERVVTVTGDGVVNPGNYKVLFGTNQNELIEAAGGLKEGCEKVNPDISVHEGRVVTGDQFVSSKEKKTWLVEHFDGCCTEMEGAAIAHVAYLNQIPFLIVRAISDKADDSAHMDYPTFEAKAIEHSVRLITEMAGRLA